jgi:hypothetical protein
LPSGASGFLELGAGQGAKPPQVEKPHQMRLEPRDEPLADELAEAPADGLHRQPEEVGHVRLRHGQVNAAAFAGASAHIQQEGRHPAERRPASEQQDRILDQFQGLVERPFVLVVIAPGEAPEFRAVADDLRGGPVQALLDAEGLPGEEETGELPPPIHEEVACAHDTRDDFEAERRRIVLPVDDRALRGPANRRRPRRCTRQ